MTNAPRPDGEAAAVTFYADETYRADDSIGFLMKRVIVSIGQQVDKRLGEHGLTSAQWGPLLKIKLAGTATAADLARWLQVDAGAMTRLLDRLEKKGLCQRVRCTEDRRVVRVRLTPEGEASIVAVPAVLCKVLNAHLAGFSEAEFHTLRAYLLRMLDAGEAMRDSG